MESNIDFLIVGAGLYGATMARLLTDFGYNCLILEKRPYVGGNIYSERINGYDKHVYGPHIFHTKRKEVRNFVKKYAKWKPYQLETIAIDNNNLYHLPFNMHTFYDIFGIYDIDKVYNIITKEISSYGCDNPQNLKDQAINIVGTTIYEKLIKIYTEKQWGKKCEELPIDIIKRLPLRFSFNNNYFNDNFQAIPEEGYTQFIKNIIGDIPYICDSYFINLNYFDFWSKKVKNIIYCGPVDELLDYKLGKLEWRSLKFKDEKYIYNGHNGQGNAIVNDLSIKNQYTRTIEHMYFRPDVINEGIESIITYEYPEKWDLGKERYYPINDEINNRKYNEYKDLLLRQMPKVKLGGRLGKYQYFNMDDVIYEAMNDTIKIIQMYN